jgi:hypothetical protein
MKVKITSLKTTLVGESVPPKTYGAAGRDIENQLRAQGFPLSNQPGADLPTVGLEVKSRDIDSTSAQSVGAMLPEDIIKTSYRDSLICDKLQQQFRVKTKDQIIVSAEVYDFSAPYIQEKIEASYEAARQKITAGDRSKYISGGPYGYFERTVKGSRSYQFRVSNNAVKKIESMSMATANKLITFE